MEVLTTKHFVRLFRFGIALTVLAAGVTGCSGIRVNQGISPATFLLPGLLGEHNAPATDPELLLAGHAPHSR